MTQPDLDLDLGDGITVRRYAREDLDAIWSAVQAERERLGVWMPWVAVTTSIEDQRRWLDRLVDDPDSLDACGIFVDSDLAGSVGLSWDPFRIGGEIGYWIRSGYEGRGLVTRAAAELTRVGFELVGLNRLVIRAGVENTRSRAVAERLGYRLESIERGSGRGSGGYYDHAVYAVLADEWASREP